MSRISSKVILSSSLNNTFDNVSNRSLKNIQETLLSIQACPLLNGVLIENITIDTSTTLVQHKLNRKYRGWIVTDSNQPFLIHTSSTSDADRKVYVPLISDSVPSIISLWVF